MAFGMSPFPLQFGSRQRGVAPPQLIWFDDFSTYASTAEMKAAGWASVGTGSTDIALNAGRMQLVTAGDGNAAARRAISGYTIGQTIKVTYTLSGNANFSGVGLYAVATDGIPLVEWSAVLGTYTFEYVTTSASTWIGFRRNTAAGALLFVDDITVMNLGPF